MVNINKNKVYGVDDLVDFDTLLEYDEYYPFTDGGKVNDEIAVSFLIRAGRVFYPLDDRWYQLYFDGIYRKIEKDESVSGDIIRFLDHHARKNGYNIPYTSPKTIYIRLKAVSKAYLDKKRDSFIENHDEYCLRYDQDFIPVLNGLIHPETMELLPNCGYFLYPNVLGFNYRKLSYDEIINSPTYDDYLGILPDKETLNFYLWWVGMVLFSPKLARIFLFLYGPAGTGKSTLSLPLLRILTPELVRQIDATAIKDNRFLTASFEKKTLIVMDEMSQKAGLLDDGIFKQITGGSDDFIVEKKYHNPYCTKLTCKIMMMGNSYPSLIQDTGVIDRTFIIPCFKEQDKGIGDIVTTDEALNWLFNAAHHFYVVEHPHTKVRHLTELRTPIMIRELEKYRSIDSFNYWLKDYINLDILDVRTVQCTLDGVSSDNIFKNYQQFVDYIGGKSLNKQKFLQRLRLEYKLVSKSTHRRGTTNINCLHIEDDGGLIGDSA